jgi:peptidoglycan/xylan/chitin deacetylase (PgdA/CDA1 family)
MTVRATRSALANRLAASAPESLLETMRLALARRLEVAVRRSGAVRGAALVFHAVAPQGGDPAHEIDPPLAADRLDSAVRYLQRRYVTVHASKLPAAARARRPGDPPPVALTFDDDLLSHLEHAMPILRRHGAVATAFVCGATGPFWWQLLQTAVDRRAIAADALVHLEPARVRAALERRPGAIRRLAADVEALTPAQRDAVTGLLAQVVPDRVAMLGADGVAALAAADWEIGFHTRRHDLLTTLDDAAVRAAIGPATAGGARTIAYPHGKATAREARAARDAGYIAAYTGRDEVLTERTDDHLIGRLQPDTATLGRFALYLARALSVQPRDALTHHP